MALSQIIRPKFLPILPDRPRRRCKFFSRVDAIEEPQITEEKSSPATGGASPYKPLETPQTIRILELFPGDPEDPIRCNLRHVELDKAPPYEAISYRWGDPRKTEEVMCGNGEVKVTTNLADCLRRIRRRRRRRCHGNAPRILWADAICINQSNKKEQGHQVRLMFEIYRRASGLLVWLGEVEDDWPLRAFAFFEKVYRRIKDSGGGYRNDRPKRYWHDYKLAHMTQEDLNELDVPDWELLTRLTENEYFERLWIYQEVGLGSGGNTKFLVGVKADLFMGRGIPLGIRSTSSWVLPSQF